MKRLLQSGGWTLTELIIVLVLVGIMATVTTVYVGNNMDATRYNETVERLRSIRTAIIGDDKADISGHRTRFGYIGDMGRFPSALTELTTRGSQVAWVYNHTNSPCNSLCNIGGGWRGPYVNPALLEGFSIGNDAWGNALIYNTSGTAAITSYGSDGASGGSGYGKDITVHIPQADVFSTVTGVFSDNDVKCGNHTVYIYFPSNGMPTSLTDTTSGASGEFTISPVPRGLRTIHGTGASCQTNRTRLVVDKPTVSVGPGLVDSRGYSGLYFNLGHYLGSSSPGFFDQVWFDFIVAYAQSMTPTYMTVSWTQNAYLKQMIIDPAGADGGPYTQNFATPLKSGTRFKVNTAPAVSFSSGANGQLELLFSTNADGTGLAMMDSVNVIVVFEWSQSSRKDTLVANLDPEA